MKRNQSSNRDAFNALFPKMQAVLENNEKISIEIVEQR